MPEKLNDMVVTYVEAIERFSECARAFLQHVDVLNQARNKYEIAATAGRELRDVLDTSDERLLTLMTQLEKAIRSVSLEAFPDKKIVQLVPATVEAMKTMKTSAGGPVVVRTFP